MYTKCSQQHYISTLILPKKTIPSRFNWHLETLLYTRPLCFVSAQHYWFPWGWKMLNYSEIANQADCLKQQDHWVSMCLINLSGNYFQFNLMASVISFSFSKIIYFMVVSVRNSERERDGGFHLGEGKKKDQNEDNSISKCQGLCLKSRYILPKILILTSRSRTTSIFFSHYNR